jgi:hypothetical protein
LLKVPCDRPVVVVVVVVASALVVLRFHNHTGYHACDVVHCQYRQPNEDESQIVGNKVE